MELPLRFVEETKALLGEEFEPFRSALLEDSPTSVRINPRRKVHLPIGNLQPVPWCEHGFYLPQRPSFTFDPYLHAGVYYVQEASSMFLDRVVRTYVDKPVVALDMCAAPGGKSTLLCDALPEGSLLVSNEFVRQRAHVLAENMTKWGNPHVVVTSNAAEDFSALPGLFDFILVDAPCSGEGMFRKDEGAVQEWSIANIQQCVERQQLILDGMWEALKPGGLLVYSTCTFNLHENEEQVMRMSKQYGAEVLAVPVSEDWGITSSLTPDCPCPVYRFLPHQVKGEGLFMAVMRKPDSNETISSARKKKSKRNAKELPIPKACKEWLAEGQAFFWGWHNGIVVALPQLMREVWDVLSEQLHVLQAGIPVAAMKGRDLIPEHALALSEVRNRQTFPEVELEYAQAIAYLRKEAVALPCDTQKGFVCVTYRGAALGWVKHLGNRANNLYPDPWRIRSGHLPEDIILLKDLIVIT